MLWGFNYNSEDKIVSFHYSPQRKEYEGMVSNIVIADCKSDNENINKLIQQLNDWADKIIELGKMINLSIASIYHSIIIIYLL